MKITYTIPKKWEITEAEGDLIKEMYREDRKDTVIKFIRFQYPDLSLYEAKQLCNVVAGVL